MIHIFHALTYQASWEKALQAHTFGIGLHLIRLVLNRCGS